MIQNSKQDWSNGSTVKVGFLKLVVICAVKTPGDHAPDAYLLRNINGTKLYRFVPHNGCTEVTLAEASAMQDAADAQGTTDFARLRERAKALDENFQLFKAWASFPDEQAAHEAHIELMRDVL